LRRLFACFEHFERYGDFAPIIARAAEKVGLTSQFFANSAV